MKKSLVIGLFFVVMFVGVAAALDVAYVTENYDKLDWVYLGSLYGLGFNVDVISDDMIGMTDFSSYHFVLVGDGNLKNVKDIPKMRTILVNSKYSKHFGFLSGGRTKSLGSNANLMVNVNEEIMDVYDSPSGKLGGPALTYNYLPERFMSDGLINHASTVTMEKNKMGSVVAFDEDKKSCYFGISETNFWNFNSWDLFSDCVKFVAGVHDVAIIAETENGVNGLRIKDVGANQYILNEKAELKCGKEYKVDYVTKNIGDFTEDVDFFAMIGNFNWTAKKTGLAPGATTTTGSKTFNVTNGFFSNKDYVLEVSAMIDNDDNILDNMRMREVMVSGC